MPCIPSHTAVNLPVHHSVSGPRPFVARFQEGWFDEPIYDSLYPRLPCSIVESNRGCD